MQDAAQDAARGEARGAARVAAQARLEAFGARLERVGLDDFRQMALSASAADARGPARAAAVRAIDAAGLGDLAEQARASAITYMDRVYTSGGFHPTWVAPNWGLSTGPLADRIAATAAVEDAALAVIAEGIATDDAVDALRAPFDLIADLHPPPAAGDAPPTLGDVRRLGPVWGTLAVLLVGFAALGWFFGEWPILVVAALAAAIAAAAWWRRPRGDPRGT